MTAPARPALTEAQWQDQVITLAKLRGWWVFHDHDSRRNAAGLPDLLLLRDRLVVAELKTTHGRIRTAQADVGARFHSAGIESYIWRPSDLPEIQRVLGPARPPVDVASVLRARLEAVAALHAPRTGLCPECMVPAPCPTVRAARGETA